MNRKALSRIILGIGVIVLSITSSGIDVSAKTIDEEILELSPGMSKEELDSSINESANALGWSKEEVKEQMLKELEGQKELSEESLSKRPQSRLAEDIGGPKYPLEPGRQNGDIFFEPSVSLTVNHGHVGIYWTSDIVVEAAAEGIRKTNIANKKVETTSSIFTLENVSAKTKNDASNWAYARIGDPYSYNFATNRLTDHYGAKNCSKLVWSAYTVMGDIDIDCDGGLGVYPRDILNYKYSKIYKQY